MPIRKQIEETNSNGHCLGLNYVGIAVEREEPEYNTLKHSILQVVELREEQKLEHIEQFGEDFVRRFRKPTVKGYTKETLKNLVMLLS